MNRTIYFADKAVTFTNRIPEKPHYLLLLAEGERVCRAKILQILETSNLAAVVTPEPDAVFEAFALDFVPVQAAGGIVVNDRGEWLMIHRNGRWDLPKGHLEEFESLEECALREVGEETGVKCEMVVRPLCCTLHCYNVYGRWELKYTHWFELRFRGEVSVVPQTEEGIDQVVWCSTKRVARNLESTYPTIRRVAECMRVPWRGEHLGA